MKKYILTQLLFIALLFSLQAQRKSVSGVVFLDNNNNHEFDKGDQPLASVPVSSLDTIVKTDLDGKFTIPVLKKDIIFVIKPEGYKFSLQDNNVPEFYRFYYQKPSDKKLFYKGVKKTTPLPKTINFPMYKDEAKTKYNAHIIGDIQTPSIKEVEFFRELIIPELLKHPADFSICLGDNADNDLDVYPALEKALNPLKTPLYMVFGNHDINYRASSYIDEAETYRKYFGPDYYAFNYGKTHFIVLNTVIYHGWNVKENKNGSYYGGVHEQQLNWLKQDLQLVEKDKRIVLLAHIPLLKNFSDLSNIVEVFSLLEDRQDLLSIYGHLHSTGAWEHDKESLWNGKGRFQGHIAGSACGAWWAGPFGPDSIPDATCYDGSPPGIYLYEFNPENYNKLFVPGGKDRDYQLRLSSPQTYIEQDSLKNSFIYVNVFDGDENTVVKYTIDNDPSVNMKKVDEIDPFVARNQHLRATRNNWTPWLVTSSHLWKAPYPKNLSSGMHSIKATCILSNGKEYSTMKVFELIEK